MCLGIIVGKKNQFQQKRITYELGNDYLLPSVLFKKKKKRFCRGMIGSHQKLSESVVGNHMDSYFIWF